MTPDSERSFEELYRELEETVQRLEAGDLTLDETLVLFERGTTVAEMCNELLDQAELRVRQLTERADGSLTAEAVDIL